MAELRDSPIISRMSILAVLIYVFAKKGDREEILLIHRDTRDLSQDDHAGKWNGLGGKTHPDESLLECSVRELHEESGLEMTPDRFQFLGFVQFPNFKPHKNEDWNVGVFYVEATPFERSSPLVKCDEGTLHWKTTDSLKALPFWPGDIFFLPHVLARRPFFGVIRYENGKVVGQDIRPFTVG